MPVLRRPTQPLTLELPPRQAQVAAETDVLVVGGGPAGLGAALAVKSEKTPRGVPIKDVQSELLRQGADLGGRKSW